MLPMSLQLDEDRVEAFAGQVATDIGAALAVALTHLGDALGLYRAMADGQPVTAAELAGRTATRERYVREWLNAQAAGGYVTYDPASDRYTLPPEHAFILADDNSPLAMAGLFQSACASIDSRRRIADAFRSGEGVGWHEHHHELFHGVERGFAAVYRGHLVAEWLPAIDGVVERLEQGGSVADVGCGHGASTLLMAEAFPNARFAGYDAHPES